MEFCSGKDFLDKFNASAYLLEYANIQNSQHMLRCFHSAFQDIPGGITVLDYGSGPSIKGTISAAAKASEIILSDYSPANLKVAQDWITNGTHSFSWDPHFSYVVKDLEGGGDDEIAQRKQDVRKTVKGFAHCDVTQDPPIEEEFNKLYDVVISSFVLENVATTDEHYFDLVRQIAQLVKPGGYFFLYGVENGHGYKVGNYVYYNFPVSENLPRDALKRCQFSLLEMDRSLSVQENLMYTFTKAKLDTKCSS